MRLNKKGKKVKGIEIHPTKEFYLSAHTHAVADPGFVTGGNLYLKKSPSEKKNSNSSTLTLFELSIYNIKINLITITLF